MGLIDGSEPTAGRLSRRTRVGMPIVVGLLVAAGAMGLGSPTPAPGAPPAALAAASPSPQVHPLLSGDRAVGEPFKRSRGTPHPTASLPSAEPEPDFTYPENCRRRSDPVGVADDLLGGRLDLGPHPAVAIPADPTWAEDPLADRNWRHRYHSMLYVLDLLDAWRRSDDDRYRTRATYLLRDWMRDNPRLGSPSDFSWGDQTTGFRATVYACAADVLGLSGWLRDALVLHGAVLAERGFYRGRGNHALDQSIGLLEAGRVVGRRDWQWLARDRIVALLKRSVDEQGVSNEQSTGYQLYNWARYSYARQRIRAVGLPLSPVFARVDRMPGMLAHSTLPDGTYETLGDTDSRRALAVPGTGAEFAATQGERGRPPAEPLAIYRAGYLFARTGWGQDRRYEDEAFVSLRWGRPTTLHGHADGGSVTLYGYGSRLLLDPGRYAYTRDQWQRYFASRSAHNVVTVDGLDWPASGRVDLVGVRTTVRVVDCRLAIVGLPGVTHARRVTFSRTLGYAVVEDRLSSATPRTYRQLWHLREDARVRTTGDTLIADSPAGDVEIHQLAHEVGTRLVRGATGPTQGWVSYTFKQRLPATVVEALHRGRRARYVTLLVPSDGSTRARISDVRLSPLGYRFVITIGGRSERISVTDDGAVIVPVRNGNASG
jgi:heparinase II/III-like protein